MGFIYKISNTINDKVYIGQTTLSIEERWQEHFKKINKGKETIYKAIRKYGFLNFYIEKIEECENSLLNDREIYWIKYYDSYKNGYNETLGGESGCKYDHNEIIKKFLELNDTALTAKYFNCSIHTVRNILNAHNIKYKFLVPIEILDPNTLEVIYSFDSMTEALSLNPDWHIGTISAAVSGKRNSAYGYFWREKGDNNKTFQKLFKQKRKVIQYDKNMNQIQIHESIQAALRSVGGKETSRSISNALNGRAKTAYGFKWKYLDEV